MTGTLMDGWMAKLAYAMRRLCLKFAHSLSVGCIRMDFVCFHLHVIVEFKC